MATLYKKTSLTGGGATALDGINGTGLLDGDFAFVMVGNLQYTYQLDDDSGAAESSPNIISPDVNAGTKRWILQPGRSVSVGSDADGDMYYRASGVLARLAKGAANTKLFTNAGATAPEWAVGIKQRNFTYDLSTASGTVDYTGFGFKPSNIIVLAGVTDTATGSIGFDDAAAHFSLSNEGLSAAGLWQSITLHSIVCVKSGSDHVRGYASSMLADGVRITYAKTGSPTGTLAISIIAFR